MRRCRYNIQEDKRWAVELQSCTKYSVQHKQERPVGDCKTRLARVTPAHL
jgi:hypothetical protein